MESENNKNEKIIHVNRKQIRVSEDELTGRQILEKAGIDEHQNDLFLIHGNESNKIEPDEIVKIKNGLHFNVICQVVPYG